MITIPRSGWSIGELARLTGCNLETVRYYERIGLMPAPPRSGGGHRVYGAGHRDRLNFVRRCRELGFQLAEVRALLALAEEDRSCRSAQAVAERHLAAVRAKLGDLRRMERTLARTVALCVAGTAHRCPLIESLSRR
jgi:MerR family mercuric resistance operon transcriptional regulator